MSICSGLDVWTSSRTITNLIASDLHSHQGLIIVGLRYHSHSLHRHLQIERRYRRINRRSIISHLHQFFNQWTSTRSCELGRTMTMILNFFVRLARIIGATIVQPQQDKRFPMCFWILMTNIRRSIEEEEKEKRRQREEKTCFLILLFYLLSWKALVNSIRTWSKFICLRARMRIRGHSSRSHLSFKLNN